MYTLLTSNPNITELDLCADLLLVEGIISRCANSLTSLQIRNDLSIASFARILRGLPRLDTLSVGVTNNLCKKDGTMKLRVPRDFVSSDTWEELARELTDITSIDLGFDEYLSFGTLPIFFLTCGANLKRLKLVGHLNSHFCSLILSHCTSLVKLDLSVWCKLDWTAMIAPYHKIETLIVRCVFDEDDILTILRRCKHLKKCMVRSIWLGCSISDGTAVESLKEALSEYQNVQNSTATLKVEWETTNNIYMLDSGGNKENESVEEDKFGKKICLKTDYWHTRLDFTNEFM